jgi:hypothetical protein
VAIVVQVEADPTKRSITFYWNGTQDGNPQTGLSKPLAGTAASCSLRLGQEFDIYNFPGQIDEVRVTSGARTSNEILSSYRRGVENYSGLPLVGTNFLADSHVIGHWGFDELNPSDAAIDDSFGSYNLAFTSAESVLSGRTGNARSFDGAASVAAASDSIPFRALTRHVTIIGWFKLDQLNAGGLRTILACDGPTSTDGQTFALYIDSNSKLVYRHEALGQQEIIRRSTESVKVGRFYEVKVVRTDVGGGNCTIDLYLDNVLMAAQYEQQGSGVVAGPVPLPEYAPTNTLKFGKSDRISGGAFWDGALDDFSIHDVARPFQPYLISVFYSRVLRDSPDRLSTIDNVQALASTDMNRGFRWWTYERDGSLYVVREGPFGVFSAEVQLTRTGSLYPGATSEPDLVYDAASDTLLVVFINSGRVFKITANSLDAAVTQQMPASADVGSIIKAIDQTEALRLGAGETALEYPYRASIVHPKAQNISFVGAPSFGIGIPYSASDGTTGYNVYEKRGGVDVLLGTATAPTTGQNFYFFAITQRVYGRSFFVKGVNGFREGLASNVIVDRLFDPATVSPEVLSFGSGGDLVDGGGMGSGGSDFEKTNLAYVNRGTVKASLNDSGDMSAGGASLDNLSPTWKVVYVNRGTVKAAMVEPSSLEAGAGGGFGLKVSGGSAVPALKKVT